MRLPVEHMIGYRWPVAIAVAGIVVIVIAALSLTGLEQNVCSGFRYFRFVDHGLSEGYIIQLDNGNTPIIITGIRVGSAGLDASPGVSMENVQPWRSFSISTGKVPDLPPDSSFSAEVAISYDEINGESGLMDSALCTGRSDGIGF